VVDASPQSACGCIPSGIYQTKMLEVISSNIRVNKITKRLWWWSMNETYFFGLNTKERKWLSFPWGSKHKHSNKEIPKALLCISIVQNVFMLDNI
jgi:hypothetical protein